MAPAEAFVWGFGGSAAMEVLAALPLFYAEPISIPARYRLKMFWFLRLILALIGGGFAIAYDVQTKLLAINVGASAPLILETLARNVPTPGINKG